MTTGWRSWSESASANQSQSQSWRHLRIFSALTMGFMFLMWQMNNKCYPSCKLNSHASICALFFSVKLSDRRVMRIQKSNAFLHTNRAWFHRDPFSRTGLHCACLSCHRFRSCAVRFLIFSLDVMWFINADNLPCPLPWFAVVACLRTVGPFSSFPP